MKTNWNKEEVNGLLDKAIGLKDNDIMSCPSWTHDKLEQFKKDNGLLPTLEEGWYKFNGCPDYLMYRAESFLYGFRTNGAWIDHSPDDNGLSSAGKLTPATHEEVETALKAEAIKRGFKEGVKFGNLSGGTSTAKFNVDNPKTFWNRSNACTMYRFNMSICNNGGVIYRDGKWAEIIDNPEVNEFTIKELEELTGKTNIKIIK
jgi:hypothetical protein